MTTTDEQIVSDNSNSQIEAASLPNGEENNQAGRLASAENEPDTNKNEAVIEADNFQLTEIPEKFRNKDGTANLSSLIKSYKELEPLINEKALWTKEKAALTSQLSAFQNKNTLSNLSSLSAYLYERFLDKATDKDAAQGLIEQLKLNPTDETIKQLEQLFPEDINKNVLIKSSKMRDIIEMQMHQQIREQEFNEAESYLKTVVEKNFEALQNPVVADIFNEVFIRYGVGLDSDWVFDKLKQLKDSVILDYQKEQSLKSEKDSAISNASKLSPDSKTKGGTSLLQRNALDLSPQELDKMLDEFYDK